MLTQFLKNTIFMIGILWSVNCYSQHVGDDVFLKGNYLEVGIAPNGTLGSSKTAPSTYHSRFSSIPGMLAIVADPDKDGWKTGKPEYIGDYIMPGSPVELWSVEVDGVLATVDRSLGAYSLPSGMSGYNDIAYWSGGRNFGVWKGNFGDLSIMQTATIDASRMYLLFDVKFKNTGTTIMHDIFYSRHTDPDNEVEVGGVYATAMKIESQNPNDNHLVSVSATGEKYGAYIGLCTRDCRAKGYFLTSGLSGTTLLKDVYSETAVPDIYRYQMSDSLVGDVGMGLIFKLDSLASGETTSIRYAYSMSKEELDYLSRYVLGPSWMYDSNYYANNDVLFVCENELVNLDIISQGSDNWIWDYSPYLAGLDGSANTITVSGANTFTAIRYDTGTCVGIDTMKITIRGIPVIKPYISKSGMKLSVPAIYAVYQWYLDGVAIPGANFSTYTMTSNGTYYVNVKNPRGCIINSDTLLENVEIDEFNLSERVNIYPNPSSGKINIDAPMPVNAKLMDMSGRLLFQKNDISEIDLSPFTSGLYFLRLEDRDGQLIEVTKVIKK